MALTGIQILKLLPKTNCGECKFPTCLAFAMALAAGKTELDLCPHVSADAKAQLEFSQQFTDKLQFSDPYFPEFHFC